MLTATKRRLENSPSFNVTSKPLATNERVISVDALRGFDMFWIMGGHPIFMGLDNVFHNRFTGFIKQQFDHVEWLGFNFWDIIMPLFLFLAGVSMVFSFKKRLSQEKSYKAIWIHTIKRVVILWILGMIVQGKLLTYDADKIELYSNTLQAIASGYLIATILTLYLPVKYQVAATAGLMLAFWAILALIPVNGTTQNAYSQYGNVAYLFDRKVLGQFHDGQDYTWIISSLNFGATTMLGVFSGYILQSGKPQVTILRNLTLYGIVMIVAGLLLNEWHPIIKKIWTSSFVLFSGGICALMLAVFYLVIDVLKFRKGSKWLVIIGSNAIFGYVAWHLFEPAFTSVSSVFVNGLKPFIGNWYQTVLYIGSFMVIFLILRFMYNRKIFIKI
jgi:predicted acyltransferase